MGDITEADLGRLRALAGRVDCATDRIDELTWSSDHLSGSLPGSAVARICFAATTSTRVDALTTGLRAWAAGARSAAARLEQADVETAGGLA